MNTYLEGRIARLNYFLSAILVSFVTGVLTAGVGMMSGLLAALVIIASMALSLSLSVRRAHDIGWSGWMVLLLFIPLVNFVVGLILIFKKGGTGANPYGAEPSTTVDVIKTLFPKGIDGMGAAAPARATEPAEPAPTNDQGPAV